LLSHAQHCACSRTRQSLAVEASVGMRHEVAYLADWQGPTVPLPTPTSPWLIRALQRAGAREVARETRTPYNLQELKNKEI